MYLGSTLSRVLRFYFHACLSFFFDTVVRSSCSRNILQPNSLEGPFELNMTNTTSTWWFQIFVIFAPYLGKISNLTNIFQLLVKHSFKDFFFLSPPSIGCLLRVLVFCVHEYSSGARVPGYRLICWYGA